MLNVVWTLHESHIDCTQGSNGTVGCLGYSGAMSLITNPLGATPGRPGDRTAFSFETLNRLPDSPEGLGRNGRRYGRTGIIHTPHGDIHTPAFIPVATQAAIASQAFGAVRQTVQGLE